MQAQFELLPDEVMASAKLFGRQRWGLLRVMFTIYGCIMVLLASPWFIRGAYIRAILFLLIAVVFFIFVPILLPLITKRKWMRQMKKVGMMTISASEEGFELSNFLSRSIMRWEAFESFVEGPKLWLLVINSSSYVPIPLRAFASEEEKMQFHAEFSRIGKTAPNVHAPPLAPP